MRIPNNVIISSVKASSRSNMKYHIGCTIFNPNSTSDKVKNGIISSGFNRWLHKGKTKYLPPCNFSIHAEEDALFGLSRRITYGASAFIYREGNLLAKPCANCQKILDKAGISHIYYSPII